jgi:hypothetical protein
MLLHTRGADLAARRRWDAQGVFGGCASEGAALKCPLFHLSTPKYRRKIFHPPLDTRLKELILEKQERYGYRVLGIEVMPDHVHLLSM